LGELKEEKIEQKNSVSAHSFGHSSTRKQPIQEAICYLKALNIL